jgi:hypothetical protein
MPENPSLRLLIDDPEAIRNTDSFLRVIQPAYFQGRDVQSNGFQDQSLDVANGFGLAGPCASVNIRRIWELESGEVGALLRDFPDGCGLLEVSVMAARRLRSTGPPSSDIPQGLMLDPRPQRPWHAVLFSLAGGKRSKAAMRALVQASTWFWHPDDNR